MKKHYALRKTVSFVTAILILLSVALSLFSCQREATKEQLLENVAATVEKDRFEHDYVTLYLYDWNFPSFDTKKLSWVEQMFGRYYNLKEGMPQTLDHAVKTAQHFLDNYYDDIDRYDVTAVTDALVTSYVDVIGDPYSVYRTPTEGDDYTQSLSGQFGGVGVTVEYDHTKKTVMIISVNENSPASSVGLLAGDYIIGVDDKKIEDIGYDRIVDHIRGKVGTDVTVTVKRDDKELSFTMTRATIEDRTVSYAIGDDGIGYIRISGFNESTTGQFKAAVDAVEAAEVRGIVFDLRSNPGGLVDVVAAMLSYLLPTGKTVVSYQFKNMPLIEVKTQDDGVDEKTNEPIDHKIDVPMAVICDEYTASAAEIFTSVVRDYRGTEMPEAVIVGKTTYKKGIMQSSLKYEDDSIITITVAYYNPPSGVNYHGTGVVPDVEVSLPELKEGETSVEDTQYKTAIEELKKLLDAN